MAEELGGIPSPGREEGFGYEKSDRNRGFEKGSRRTYIDVGLEGYLTGTDSQGRCGNFIAGWRRVLVGSVKPDVNMNLPWWVTHIVCVRIKPRDTKNITHTSQKTCTFRGHQRPLLCCIDAVDVRPLSTLTFRCNQ